VVHELLARERLPGVPRQEQQQIELPLRELDIFSVTQPGSTLRPSTSTRGACSATGSPRRRMAPTRATSSPGENGFTT
jgi:hypothetical protein